VSIRKRAWSTLAGKHECWLVDYVDQGGVRRAKSFKHKRDAVEFAATTRVQVRQGTHVADSASITVKQAGELWLETSADLERSTQDQYKQHLNLHIAPFIGREKLSKITVGFVREFQDRLKQEGRSAVMIRNITRSLGSIIADAQERNLAAHNAVRELHKGRRGRNGQRDRRNGRLKVGVDIPTPEEVRAILGEAEGKWRVLLLTATFSGLRASELRGLRWGDVDLQRGELHVRQRADRYNKFGPPKSAAGERTTPLPPTVVAELREWKLVCPKRDGRLGLVFPNTLGKIESLSKIVSHGLIPAVLAAGLTLPVLDDQGIPKRDAEGKPIVKAKYSGLHSLRHFFASWCINRKEDGGLGLPGKVVQERLGHASITMTMDRYGHLFPRGDDTAELAAAERALLGQA